MNARAYILIILTITALIASVYDFNLSKNIKQEEKTFYAFKKDLSELIALKKKWQNKNTDKTLSELKRISPDCKIYKKRGRKIIKMEKLSQKDLKRVLRTTFNSNLKIKKFVIEKYNDKISIYIETKV